ncbi:hypothetical protein BGX26_002076 [Mortierella sp. AD094]|nr:hypothetical protein BGX26_002076 [Mortierella sp. AD094]
MMHERPRGRYRPIVTTIEAIIWIGDSLYWKKAIDNTESELTSYKEQERPGNLIRELNRIENKISKHPEQFASLSSIKETLGLFIYRWFVLGETAIVLEDEAQLVEAAFGRIKMLGGNAKVVMDEALVLKTATNYFNKVDPLFIAAAKRAMLSSNNASVHGSVWETIGHGEQEPRLAISYRDITTQAFMEAHIQGGSKQGDNTIPPFYFPSPHVSGPDLKLRQVLAGKDADEALATTSSQTVQEKMNKEHEKINEDQEKVSKEQQKQQKNQQSQTIACTESEKQLPPRLQDYCPSGVYISMVIAYPAKVVSFQVMRPDPEPELEGLLRVIINVDDRNFAQIFPKSHVNFLDNLRKLKRSAEDQDEQHGSDKSRANFKRLKTDTLA